MLKLSVYASSIDKRIYFAITGLSNFLHLHKLVAEPQDDLKALILPDQYLIHQTVDDIGSEFMSSQSLGGSGTERAV
jgi:hypothetical protein